MNKPVMKPVLKLVAKISATVLLLSAPGVWAQAPAQGSVQAPAQGSVQAPAQGSVQAPAQGSVQVPNQPIAAAPVLKSASEKSLSFDAARQTIMNNLPELVQARSAHDAARLRALPMIYGSLPKLDLSASQLWQGTPKPLHDLQSFAGVSASINVFKGGADFYSLTQGRELQKKADEDLLSTEIQIEAQVSHALVDLLSAAEGQDIAKLRVEATKTALEVAKARFGRGLIPDQDVERLTIEYDQSVAELSDSEIAYIKVRNAVKSKIGGVELELGWPWIEAFQKSDFLKLRDRPIPPVDAVPSFRAAQLGLAAAESAKGIERGAILPSLDLTSSFGWAGTRVFDSNTKAWQAGVTLSMPLFDRLASISAFRASIADSEAAKARLSIEGRDRTLDLENAQTALRLAHTTALARAKIVDRSYAFYQKSLALLKAGRISTNDLVLDEGRWLQARSLASQGWAGLHSAWIDSCSARGLRIDACWSP